MAISYTAATLKRWLRADATHGPKHSFLLSRMAGMGAKFEVQDLYLRNFDGTKNGVFVDDGASNKAEAVRWALDGIREWAGIGTRHNGNYFGTITRDWATSGPGAGSTASSIGTTIDWIYLYSEDASTSGTLTNSDMLPIRRWLGAKHGCALLCWVYANRWDPTFPGTRTRAAVNIQGPVGGGPPGLHSSFWDSTPGHTHEDQAHHFGGYFFLGAFFGTNRLSMHAALAATGDYSISTQTVTNQGDYDLGFMAARCGRQFRRSPGFIGSSVQADLISGKIW